MALLKTEMEFHGSSHPNIWGESTFKGQNEEKDPEKGYLEK